MNTEFEYYLAVARAKSCTEQAVVSFISRVIVGVVTAASIWSMFSPGPLLGWLAVNIIVAFFALRMNQAFAPSSLNDFNIRKWNVVSSVSTLSALSVGGSLPYFFSPQATLFTYRLSSRFILVILLGR